MKIFKSFYLFFLASFFTLSINSCDKSEKLKSFIEAEAPVFKSAMDSQGEGVQIVDFRDSIAFKAGHIPGAKNIQATLTNTTSNEAEFAQKVLEKFDPTKRIFLYGGRNNFEFQRLAPARASALGFGRENTWVLMGGFEAWEAAGYDVIRP